MFKEAKFDHYGRALTARASVTDNEIKVRVYDGDTPATAAVYTISIETAFDSKVRGFSLGVVDELVELAIADVTEERIPLIEKSPE